MTTSTNTVSVILDLAEVHALLVEINAAQRALIGDGPPSIAHAYPCLADLKALLQHEVARES